MTLKTTLKKVVIGYLVLCAIMFSIQRNLLFIGSGPIELPEKYGLKNFQEVILNTQDGDQIKTWFSGNEDSKKIVILFFGNADSLIGYTDFFRYLTDNKIAVLGVCYRGYCGTEGKPSEENIYKDARIAVNFVKAQYPKGEITVFGRSLGSGVAVEMAKEFNLKKVVLLSPYTSIPNAGQEIYWFLPVKYLARDELDSESKISSLDSKILIFHGNKDDVIPFSHSQKLAELSKGKSKLVELNDLGHNNINLLNIAPQIASFINAD